MARVSTGFKYYGTLEVKLKTKMISRPLTTRCFRFFVNTFLTFYVVFIFIICCAREVRASIALNLNEYNLEL